MLLVLLLLASPVEAQWSASRGSVTSTGRYTAPSTAGTDRVVFRHNGFADTATVTVGASGGSTLAGIPFGHFKEPAPGSPLRSAGYLIVPQGQLDQLPAIKSRGGKVVVNVVGGGACALDANGQLQFPLWVACWNKNLTATRKAQVKAYADSGTVFGTYLIDEPNLVSRWGTVTPATVCEMARYARTELPGLPVLVRAAADWVRQCDAIDAVWAQYGSRRGVEVNQYRDQQLAASRALGYAQVFSLNALNDDASGTDMTPQQVTEYGTALMVPGVCAFYVWEYATSWSERPEIKTALDSLGKLALKQPATSCRRPT